MPVTINYSAMQTAQPKPIRVRYKRSLAEVLKQAADSVERRNQKLNLGRFNPLPKGRALTRFEKIFGLSVAAAFSLAIWIHALPEPVSAHAGYFQSLALTGGGGAASVQAFTESAVRSFGGEWKAPALFARAHPLFWHRLPVTHPNELTKRVERGLAALARHGAVMSVTVFGTPVFGTMPMGENAAAVVTSRVTGQAELADGTVVRLEVLLAQDEKSKQWGIAALSLPPFLP
ncbi:MAG: hypothetical protein PSV13_18090 [Lacunisphaera sp.]|nr:hypothetical protein [Lacunisphaera sp.]